MNIKGSKKKNQVLSVNIFEQQEIIAKADAIKTELKASTWHELETKGKFDKNDKLPFVSDDMLILECDIGSETHYVRAIDTRGRELSKSAFCFSNTAEGFESMLDRSTKLAAANDKKQIVLRAGAYQSLLVLSDNLAGCKGNQCCAGESIRSKADKRGRRQQPA